MEQQPLVAGKYRILAELGRGGGGVVYRAEDTPLLAPELASDPRYDALLYRLNLSDVAA